MHLKLAQLTIAVWLLLAAATSGFTAPDTSSTGLIYEQTREWKLPYAPLDIVQSVDGKYIFILTDNHKVLIYEPDGSLKGSVPVDEGVTAIDADARGEFIVLIDKTKQTFSSVSVDFVVDIDTTGSPFKGNPNAKVTVAVFTDFE